MSEEKTPSGQNVVGYRQPPVEHRFQKGRSGNPRGRPRKKTASSNAAADPILTHHLADLVMAEAIRPIQVRENDEIIELPLIQAVIRSLGVAAVKGSHRAQMAITGMVKAVQDKALDDRALIYQAVIDYKQGWEEAFEACDARGEPRPDPVPHPHEIVLDHRTLQVRYNGPQTPDAKREWDQMLQRRKEALDEVADLKRRLRRPSKFARFFEDDLKHEQGIADMIGAIFPDEETRRRPGFDIREWRERQQAFRKIKQIGRKTASND